MQPHLDESVQLWLKVTFTLSCARAASCCQVSCLEFRVKRLLSYGRARINTSGHKPTGKKNMFFFSVSEAMEADAAQMVNRAAAHIKMPRCVNIYIPHQSQSALIPLRAALGIHLWLTLIHTFGLCVVGKLRGGGACHSSVALDFISCVFALLTTQENAHKFWWMNDSYLSSAIRKENIWKTKEFTAIKSL